MKEHIRSTKPVKCRLSSSNFEGHLTKIQARSKDLGLRLAALLWNGQPHSTGTACLVESNKTATIQSESTNARLGS